MSILMGGVKLDTVRKTATKDGVYTVLVQGDLVDEMAEFLKEKLSELLNSSPVLKKVILDLSRVSTIDFTALLYMVEAYRSMEQRGCFFELHNVTQDICDIMEILGLSNLVKTRERE